MYSGTSDKGHSEIRTTSDNGQTKMHQLDIFLVCKLASEMRTTSVQASIWGGAITRSQACLGAIVGPRVRGDGNANGTGIGKTSGKSDFHHWSGTGHWEGMYTGKSSSCPPFEHLSRVVATTVYPCLRCRNVTRRELR